MLKKWIVRSTGIGALMLATTALAAAAPPSDTSFAQSYAENNVSSVNATTQKVSCYAPEVTYFDTLAAGYPGGGMSPCLSGATTGEQTQGFDTQDVSNPPMLVKDHSESDLRVDPGNPLHLIGQSKWFVSAEGYNHLLGFYESWDGGKTFTVQGHVPGYEGWTDNTDPVGAFDPWGNFYSLLLPYEFVYSKSGGHVYNNGTRQANPAQPPEAVSVAVHPAALPGEQTATNWITTHDGSPDFVFTTKNADTNTPDKQWIAIDTNPPWRSSHSGRVYAMFTQFVLNPSRILLSYAQANPDGTHSDWSAPSELPTIPGHPFDTYLLPHVAPDGTVYTTVTNNPVSKGFLNNSIYLLSSNDGGDHWNGPTLVVPSVLTPTYRNTTFSEGIVNSFGLGSTKVDGHWPLYVAYENEDPDGFSRVYVTGSLDGGATWSSPIRVNDGPDDAEALQPHVEVAPNGTVAVAFYDRRLDCPSDPASGVQLDPLAPAGAHNFCVNTAIQFYKPDLTPVGHNIRLSQFTWDPQLNAPKRFCICSSTTFLGDYFGLDFGGRYTYTTSISTYDDGSNPHHYQQQVVARIATP